MNILFASAEVAPYAKAGGLGDVAGSLPGALRRLGHDVRIVMPRYRTLRIDPLSVRVLLPSFHAAINDPSDEGSLLMTHLPDKTPVYLLDFPLMFDRAPQTEHHNGIYGYDDDIERFITFNRGVIALAQHLRNVEGWNPDVVHANDWHTGLLPNYLHIYRRDRLPDTASVFTIHNLAYQGKTSMWTPHLSELGDQAEEAHNLPPSTFNFMARGIIFADIVTTVSPEYAHEITLPEYGEGLHRLLALVQQQKKLSGILNGIDTNHYNPETDTHLVSSGYCTYSASDLSGKTCCKAALQAECSLEVNPDRPLLAMVTRLVEQKGMNMLIDALPALLHQVEDAQIVILGTDEDKRYQATLRYLESRYPGQLHVFIGFFPELAQHIYAGCDMIIVPSLFEPCGLIQMIAMRYGSIPIVRKTGGLADTVHEGTNGTGNGFVFGEPVRAEWVQTIDGLSKDSADVQDFVFQHYHVDQLLDAILRALTIYRNHPDVWRAIQRNGMSENHSWDVAAQPYESMYAEACARCGLTKRK